MTAPAAPLDEVHAAAGALLVQRGGVTVPERFVDLDEEHRRLTERVGVVHLGGEGVVAVSGSDRARFLDGLLAAMGDRAPSARAGRALLLTEDGRVAVDLVVVPGGTETLLVTLPAARGRAHRLLGRHVVTDEVELTDRTREFVLLTVQGPLARSAVEATLRTSLGTLLPGEVRRVDDVLVWQTARAAPDGLDLLVPASAARARYGALLAAATGLDGGPAGLAALEILRVERGRVRFGEDLDERAPLEQLGPPEQVVDLARSGFLGCCALRERVGHDPRRRVVGLAFDGTVPAVRDDPLLLEDWEVGRVRTATRSPRLGHAIGFGLVESSHAEPGTELHTGDGGRVRVVELPFVA